MALQKPAVAGRRRPARSTGTTFTCASSSRRRPSAEDGAISPDGSDIAFRSQAKWRRPLDRPRRRQRSDPADHRQPESRARSPGARRFMGRFALFPRRQGQHPDGQRQRPADRRSPMVPFQAKMTIKRDEEFAEMFDQSWRALSENFYDPNFHGANWNAIREKYRPLVKHVALARGLLRPGQLDDGRAERVPPWHQGVPTLPEQADRRSRTYF